MIKFILVIIIYYFFVNHFFDRSVRPMGRKIQRRLIPLPKELINTWILVAGTLFPMMSIDSDVPESFLEMTPKLKHVPPERRRLTEVLTIPVSMATILWNLILEGCFPSVGPRVVTSLDDIRGRGNYMVIGNDEDFLFLWAPVYESTEFFAKHWVILRYCFEKGLVKDNTRMWGVGETLRESDGIKINNFSGSFQIHMSESLFPFNVSHIFDDVGIKCPIIPVSLGEFDPEKCYRYNVLPGVFKNFSIYDLFMENQTYDDVFMESSPFVRPGRLDEFKKEMYRLSRLV